MMLIKKESKRPPAAGSTPRRRDRGWVHEEREGDEREREWGGDREGKDELSVELVSHGCDEVDLIESHQHLIEVNSL